MSGSSDNDETRDTKAETSTQTALADTAFPDKADTGWPGKEQAGRFQPEHTSESAKSPANMVNEAAPSDATPASLTENVNNKNASNQRHHDGKIQDAGDTSDKRKVANAIADGHAYNKHVSINKEFKDLTKEGFAKKIEATMISPDLEVSLDNGRTGYANNKEGMVVIHSPLDKDNGTAFRPYKDITPESRLGKLWWNEGKNRQRKDNDEK